MLTIRKKQSDLRHFVCIYIEPKWEFFSDLSQTFQINNLNPNLALNKVLSHDVVVSHSV